MNAKIAFVEFERRILMNLVNKYSDIIESKKTDSNSVYKKQHTWQRITQEYNRQPNVRKRLPKQLKRLWENTKARAKRNSATTSSTNNAQQLEISNYCDQPEVCMDRNSTESNKSNCSIDVAGFDQMFDQSNANIDLPPAESTNKNNQKAQYSIENEEVGSNSLEEDDNNYDQMLMPIISSRIKKIEESTVQQKELHGLMVQKERLQLKLLQDKITNQTQLHNLQMDKERKLYDIRIKQEQDLHLQRVRYEQELHQLKISEYNKVQTVSSAYPLMYK